MDLATAHEMAREHLAASLPMRWQHVQGVAARCETVGFISAGDRPVLVSAALLHDIGYSPSLVVTGFHALDGASYLRRQGVSARICALVAHHSCAYREAELRGQSAELTEWEDEQSSLRDALWWADMTTAPNGSPTNVSDRIEEIQKRYGPDDLVTLFIRQARSELVGAVERTEARLRAGSD